MATKRDLRPTPRWPTYAIYSCVTLIAADIGKLTLRLVQQDDDGIWTDATSAAFSPVLRKPNRYQTINKFVELDQFETDRREYVRAETARRARRRRRALRAESGARASPGRARRRRLLRTGPRTIWRNSRRPRARAIGWSSRRRKSFTTR